MAKYMSFNMSGLQDARSKIRSGIKQLVDAVGITLGPSGRVVMYEREGGDPVITKDGVTVARQIQLTDPFENMAASAVRQAASKTATIAGDGTTTATIYVGSIFEAGIKSIAAGASPQEVKRGIDYATKVIIERFKGMAKPVVDLEQIKQVAICSSNQDQEIGSVIARALDEVGRDGVVTIEEGQTMETTVSVIDGLQFPRGYYSPQFATNPESLLCEYDEANILIIGGKLADMKSLLHIMEDIQIKALKNAPLVFIADEFSDDCLSAMLIWRIKNQRNIVAVKSPGFGDRKLQVLEDLAIATGGTVISKDGIGLQHIAAGHLGKCKRIRIDRDTTTIFEGCGKPGDVAARVQLLRTQLEKVVGDFDKERVQERLARLTGGIAMISVGGATEVEVREKKDRIDDALHACKAAIEEGILPGGAVAALHASKIAAVGDASETEDFAIGVNALLKALEAPLRQIAINTGIDDGVVVDKVKEPRYRTKKPSADNLDINFGFDAVSKQYGDMIGFGIVVPAKVERVALQNAASVAGLLLLADCLIAINKDNIGGQAAGPFPSLSV